MPQTATIAPSTVLERLLTSKTIPRTRPPPRPSLPAETQPRLEHDRAELRCVETMAVGVQEGSRAAIDAGSHHDPSRLVSSESRAKLRRRGDPDRSSRHSIGGGRLRRRSKRRRRGRLHRRESRLRFGDGRRRGRAIHPKSGEAEHETRACTQGREGPALVLSHCCTGRLDPWLSRPQAEDDEERLRAHRQIDDEVPVAQVPEIVGQLDGCALAVCGVTGANLGPAGDARLDEQPLSPGGNDRLEQLDELRPFGARPDDGHVAAENVQQLRKLVQVRPPQQPADTRRARVAGTGPDRTAAALRVGAHRPELVDREQPPALADPGLPEHDRPPRRRNEQRNDDQHRREDDQGERGKGEVERTLRPARGHPLAKMDQAHEPRRRQVRHRHAAEGPLVEAREPDHPEAPARDLEQLFDRVVARGAVGEHDQLRATSLHDRRQLRNFPQERDPLRTGLDTVPDRAHDLERHPGPLHFVDERIGDPRRADDEHAPPRHACTADEPLPDGDQTEDRGCGCEKPRCRQPQPGDPFVQGGGEHQARDGTDCHGDRRVDGVVPGSEGAAESDDPDRGQQGNGEEATRRAPARGSRIDREPDEGDAATPRECPSDCPVAWPPASIRKARTRALR